MRNVTLVVGGRAGEGHKGWGKGSRGEPGTGLASSRQATSLGPGKLSTKLSYLILTFQFIREGWGGVITMDRAFATSLEGASAGG